MLEDVIEIASSAYPDGFVEDAFKGQDTGDGLAKFIADELSGINSDWDDLDMIDEAIRLMECAATQLKDVLDALYRKQSTLAS